MEEKILNVLISMQSDICDMKSDICNMKSDIKEIKQDIKQLNERVDRLEERMDKLEKKVEDSDRKHDKHYIQLINQRQIDSNNIAQILNIQTQMLRNQEKMYA